MILLILSACLLMLRILELKLVGNRGRGCFGGCVVIEQTLSRLQMDMGTCFKEKRSIQGAGQCLMKYYM